MVGKEMSQVILELCHLKRKTLYLAGEDKYLVGRELVPGDKGERDKDLIVKGRMPFYGSEVLN